MTLPITNLKCSELAAYLAAQRPGATFSVVIYKKVGAKRKGVIYGDETVLDTLVTGFSYENLCRKDRATLQGGLSASELRLKIQQLKKLDKTGRFPSLTDCQQAILAQLQSVERSLDGSNVSTTDHVREPVVVDGRVIPGCWVNNGLVDRGKAGVAYLYGLRVGRKIMAPPTVGPVPAARQGAVPLAKDVLRRHFLKAGRWASVRLDPSSLVALKLGGEAAALADQHGIIVKPEVASIVQLWEER